MSGSKAVELAGPLDAAAGGIIDIFPCDGARFRCGSDFFGDEIESIRAFDNPKRGGSVETLDSITILPAREMPLDDDSRIEKALHRIQHELPRKIDLLKTENLESRGEEHAARVSKSWIRFRHGRSLSAKTYFDQAEVYFSTGCTPDDQCALDFHFCPAGPPVDRDR